MMMSQSIMLASRLAHFRSGSRRPKAALCSIFLFATYSFGANKFDFEGKDIVIYSATRSHVLPLMQETHKRFADKKVKQQKNTSMQTYFAYLHGWDSMPRFGLPMFSELSYPNAHWVVDDTSLSEAFSGFPERSLMFSIDEVIEKYAHFNDKQDWFDDGYANVQNDKIVLLRAMPTVNNDVSNNSLDFSLLPALSNIGINNHTDNCRSDNMTDYSYTPNCIVDKIKTSMTDNRLSWLSGIKAKIRWIEDKESLSPTNHLSIITHTLAKVAISKMRLEQLDAQVQSLTDDELGKLHHETNFNEKNERNSELPFIIGSDNPDSDVFKSRDFYMLSPEFNADFAKTLVEMRHVYDAAGYNPSLGLHDWNLFTLMEVLLRLIITDRIAVDYDQLSRSSHFWEAVGESVNYKCCSYRSRFEPQFSEEIQTIMRDIAPDCQSNRSSIYSKKRLSDNILAIISDPTETERTSDDVSQSQHSKLEKTTIPETLEKDFNDEKLTKLCKYLNEKLFKNEVFKFDPATRLRQNLDAGTSHTENAKFNSDYNDYDLATLKTSVHTADLIKNMSFDAKILPIKDISSATIDELQPGLSPFRKTIVKLIKEMDIREASKERDIFRIFETSFVFVLFYLFDYAKPNSYVEEFLLYKSSSGFWLIWLWLFWMSGSEGVEREQLKRHIGLLVNRRKWIINSMLYNETVSKLMKQQGPISVNEDFKLFPQVQAINDPEHLMIDSAPLVVVAPYRALSHTQKRNLNDEDTEIRFPFAPLGLGRSVRYSPAENKSTDVDTTETEPLLKKLKTSNETSTSELLLDYHSGSDDLEAIYSAGGIRIIATDTERNKERVEKYLERNELLGDSEVKVVLFEDLRSWNKEKKRGKDVMQEVGLVM